MATKLSRLKTKAVKLATAKKLEKYPYCTFCPSLANTCHHYIPQSRSNYLRCDERNLIPICQKCHYNIHSADANKKGLILQKLKGDDWRDGLIQDSNKTIKDGIKYWTELIEELT